MQENRAVSVILVKAIASVRQRSPTPIQLPSAMPRRMTMRVMWRRDQRSRAGGTSQAIWMATKMELFIRSSTGLAKGKNEAESRLMQRKAP
ncbi:hypothetical protein KSX_57940 [Ktedonospora formicarum]|uniref:Uncharacterized protein n=1 Tax=Ktedonospora formicarum TaxID=2778364 RepID=A0A8J3I2M0_9CHLR|nr:hypothetical protein KSX_57940 [Ktedonospora formicarum]